MPETLPRILLVDDERENLKALERTLRERFSIHSTTNPAEVEEFFMTNPKVEIVQIVGVPDQKFGEQAVAIIKLKPNEKWTEEEAKEWCKGKIATFKIPNYIKFINDFPMTANGKIQKYKLREQIQKELKTPV